MNERPIESLLRAVLAPPEGPENPGCPTRDSLVGLVGQRLPPEEQEQVRGHVAQCPDCDRRVTRLRAGFRHLERRGRAIERELAGLAGPAPKSTAAARAAPRLSWRLVAAGAGLAVAAGLVGFGIASRVQEDRVAAIRSEMARARQRAEEAERRTRADAIALQARANRAQGENATLQAKNTTLAARNALLATENARLQAERRKAGADGPTQPGPPDPAPVRVARLVEEAVASASLPVPGLLAQLASPALRAGASITLLSPVATAVLSDRPLFRWRTSSDATTFDLVVADSRGRLPIRKRGLMGSEWKPRDPLSRGQTYDWQVSPTDVPASSEAPRARFRILSSEELARVEAERRAYADAPLTLAVLYARVGLLDEAEHQLAVLLKQQPGSRAVRDLLANLRARRPETAPAAGQDDETQPP